MLAKLMDLCVLVSILASLALVGCGPTDRSDDGGGAGTAGGGTQDGGVGGAAGTGGCVDFSHSEALWGPPRDLRVVGTGFEAHEGNTVRLVITQSGEPRYGVAETAIKNGAFEFALPGAVSNYTGMGVYIDKGNDDACTVDVDPSWQRTTGGDHGPVRWEFTPSSEPALSDSPCNINGIFDIMKTLPCPS